MRRMLVALILVTALFPIPVMSQTDENGGIVIEEILVSASSAQYNALIGTEMETLVPFQTNIS